MHVSTNAIQMILSFTKGGICKVQTVDLFLWADFSQSTADNISPASGWGLSILTMRF